MCLDHYSQDDLKAQILQVIGKYLDLNLYRVFIFGSRVGRFSSERSDIDIGILGPRELGGKVRVDILEDLENLPTLYRFDLVDFNKVTPEFREEALKNIEYVN